MILHSGIGTYLRNLLPHFKESGAEVQLIVNPAAIERISWLPRFDLILSSAPIYSLKEQLQLPRIIPSCDLFWEPHFNIPLLPIRAKKRVVTVHDVYHLAHFSKLRLHEKLYAKLIFARLKKFADQIITISQFSKAEISKHTEIPQENIVPIYCGVDRAHFYPAAAHASSLKEKYGLPEKFILFVGNLKPHKNLRGLIQAFQHVRENGFSEYGLAIVGKGKNLFAAETAFSEKIDNLHFLQNVEDNDLPLLYQSASLFVLPSFYEGFGLPTLEAMSCGCPVVASKAASLPEVCGAAAEYVDPHDPLDIARGIKRVLSEPMLQQELKQKGFKQADAFSWKKAAQLHLQIFENMVK